MIKTYSLPEVAAALCGDSMAEPQRWLTAQIVAGRFTARRVGRHWRMTEQDIANALEVIANRAAETVAPVASTTAAGEVGRPSAASMRRRLVVAQ